MGNGVKTAIITGALVEEHLLIYIKINAHDLILVLSMKQFFFSFD